VRLVDLWGFACAQPFVGVSAEMHEEFGFRYDRETLRLFGLNCIGCCEPFGKKHYTYIESIPNVRRISVSRAGDVGIAAECLGDDYILSWKPKGDALAFARWDCEAFERYVRTELEKTTGCVVEIVLGVESCHGEPERLRQATEAVMRAAQAMA